MHVQVFVLSGALALSTMSSIASAQRMTALPMGSDDLPTMRVVLPVSDGGEFGGLAGSCDAQVSSHTDADFGGDAFVVQAGFAQLEMAACSYTIPADSFPIKIDLAEMVFATSNSTMTTTTEWSIIFYEGTPRDGSAAFTFSSDGIILPHIQIPAGTNGVHLQVSVDPGDPEQVILQNNGSNTFSVAFRIDQHNQQTSNPCVSAPPSCCNAFPTTDVGGLNASSENWIWALDCGVFGCPEGWNRFSEWPSLCRPSGDWVMRATWTATNCNATGACCLVNGACVDDVSESDCVGINGFWAGLGSECDSANCEPPSEDVPCCFSSTGGCVEMSLDNCLAAGGVAGPEGVSCSLHTCFPEGAVCMPNGACIDGLTPEEAKAMGGTFMGDGTTCATTNCPQPTGACCFETGFCLEWTQDDCETAGASWQGDGTTCEDADDNGTADACEDDDVVGDLNGDGIVDGADLTILLGAWGTDHLAADIDGSGLVDGADLTILLGNWTG